MTASLSPGPGTCAARQLRAVAGQREHLEVTRIEAEITQLHDRARLAALDRLAFVAAALRGRTCQGTLSFSLPAVSVM